MNKKNIAMSTREKIVIIIMILAIAYAGYDFFLSSPPKTTSVDTERELELLNKLVTDVTQNLSKEDLSETDAYILARAEVDWVKDPFCKEKFISETPKSAAKVSHEITFNYSGFVEMAQKKMAIINGLEYETGEELELGGHIVRKIYPNKVVIEVREKKRKIIVPLVEEVL